MIHIVLMILAAVGKIILLLLGLILLLLLLILFVPVRYKGSLQVQGRQIQIRGHVSWLLHLIHVQAAWVDKKLNWDIRLLGIPVRSFLKKIKSGKKDKKTEEETQQQDGETLPEVAQETADTPKEAAVQNTEADSGSEQQKAEETQEQEMQRTDAEDQPAETVQRSGNEPEGEIVQETAAASETEPGTESVQETEEEPKEETVQRSGKTNVIKSVFQKLKTAASRGKTAADRIRGRFSGLHRKLTQLLKKKDRLLEFLRSEVFREGFALAKTEVTAVIRHVIPRRLKGKLAYGTGDPGTTGEILACIAAFYPVLPKKLSVQPDFEEKLLDCDMNLKGRIVPAVLLFHGGKLILNKKFRHLINVVRHKEAL